MRRALLGAASLIAVLGAVPLALRFQAAPHARLPPAPAAADLPEAPGAATPGYDALPWSELVPPGWDPLARYRGLDLSTIRDGDTTAQAWQQDMAQAFQDAPLRQDLDGRKVAITGYVVPLQVSWDGLDEFLLVPYFGACIHSPPPPPNQIVHVRAAAKVPGLHAMDVVTAKGTLRVARADAGLAVSGYALNADGVREASTAR
ncbi:hypothetical protein CDN99_21495 [Roseateles aquatilis]|uniref:DUF3299 domain-containing protein n=1 Tax=Roseateles aquatilis TaxID=431061 RepID=A0A246IZ88_9BURK|nr:DUF3299 domain-containing protein [Roseateles aquatilis]OWQ85659.1 hypothetical protein CDN99_21495 [Roseateles aquatilis]